VGATLGYTRGTLHTVPWRMVTGAKTASSRKQLVYDRSGTGLVVAQTAFRRLKAQRQRMPMSIRQIALFASLIVGCVSHAEPPAAAPEPAKVAPDPASNPDRSPMTPGEPELSPTPKATSARPDQGRLELRHFYLLAPDGNNVLIVTRSDAPGASGAVPPAVERGR
jgi:hypothetical protein